MSDDIEVKVVTMPMLDTGIGKLGGFRDDAHLIEVAKAERDAMPEWQRQMCEELDRKMEHAFINGPGGIPPSGI
jgi:hypothetical protein